MGGGVDCKETVTAVALVLARRCPQSLLQPPPATPETFETSSSGGGKTKPPCQPTAAAPSFPQVALLWIVERGVGGAGLAAQQHPSKTGGQSFA